MLYKCSNSLTKWWSAQIKPTILNAKKGNCYNASGTCIQSNTSNRLIWVCLPIESYHFKLTSKPRQPQSIFSKVNVVTHSKIQLIKSSQTIKTLWTALRLTRVNISYALIHRDGQAPLMIKPLLIWKCQCQSKHNLTRSNICIRKAIKPGQLWWTSTAVLCLYKSIYLKNRSCCARQCKHSFCYNLDLLKHSRE